MELKDFLKENSELQSQLQEAEKDHVIQKELLEIRQSELSEITNNLLRAQEYQVELENQLMQKDQQVDDLHHQQKQLYDEVQN